MRDDEVLGDINKLKIATNIMKKVKAFQSNHNEEYVIILGNAQGKRQKIYTSLITVDIYMTMTATIL